MNSYSFFFSIPTKRSAKSIRILSSSFLEYTSSIDTIMIFQHAILCCVTASWIGSLDALSSPLYTSKASTNLRRQTTELFQAKRGGGGRAPGQGDQVLSSDEWQPTPCKPGEARLTIIQITDTYTLENLASVKTLVADVKEKSEGAEVVRYVADRIAVVDGLRFTMKAILIF